MNSIAALMGTLAPVDGFNTTQLPGTTIYKATQYRGREPICYNQGIILVGQGAKRVYLGDAVYDYNPENYLVLSTPIPAECETQASKDHPLLSLIVDIDMGMLHRIIGQMDEQIDHTLLTDRKKHKAIYAARVTPEITDIVFRLLHALHSKLETSILGRGLIYELLFRVMCGENAGSLHALAMKNTNLSKIDKALKRIHASYRAAMTVDSLSALVNMSPSAFHRAFNDVTASSPIQYIKKLRLSKAREMLIEQDIRVGEAAVRVGYESAAQFSREFKRYFGTTPRECKNQNRGMYYRS